MATLRWHAHTGEFVLPKVHGMQCNPNRTKALGVPEGNLTAPKAYKLTWGAHQPPEMIPISTCLAVQQASWAGIQLRSAIYHLFCPAAHLLAPAGLDQFTPSPFASISV